ncbi:bacteriocin [Polycladidibacter hongkongensis]|uniref:bacteriocin n=1 Tax=Polycladidibacter hongkongensis TaxID=1647556 RepID=UPI00082DB4C4|nr:bacteriocin [Pseudovibrio hongkongensis]
MKKTALLCLALFALAACDTARTSNRNLLGAGVGAATGAAVAAATGAEAGGVLAGAAIGGVAGGVLADQTAPKNCTAYDKNGRPFAVKCP